MVAILAMSRAVIVVLCAAAVLVSLVVWTWMRPPVLVSSALPPVMRRGVYWWLAMTLLFAFVALCWVILREPLGLPRHGPYRYVPLALGLAPILIVNPIYLWRTNWIRRSVERAEGRACTCCAYELTGLDPLGTCPECGKPYDIERDMPLWKGLLKAGQAPAPADSAPDDADDLSHRSDRPSGGGSV